MKDEEERAQRRIESKHRYYWKNRDAIKAKRKSKEPHQQGLSMLSLIPGGDRQLRNSSEEVEDTEIMNRSPSADSVHLSVPRTQLQSRPSTIGLRTTTRTSQVVGSPHHNLHRGDSSDPTEEEVEIGGNGSDERATHENSFESNQNILSSLSMVNSLPHHVYFGSVGASSDSDDGTSSSEYLSEEDTNIEIDYSSEEDDDSSFSPFWYECNNLAEALGVVCGDVPYQDFLLSTYDFMDHFGMEEASCCWVALRKKRSDLHVMAFLVDNCRSLAYHAIDNEEWFDTIPSQDPTAMTVASSPVDAAVKLFHVCYLIMYVLDRQVAALIEINSRGCVEPFREAFLDWWKQSVAPTVCLLDPAAVEEILGQS